MMEPALVFAGIYGSYNTTLYLLIPALLSYYITILLLLQHAITVDGT